MKERERGRIEVGERGVTREKDFQGEHWARARWHGRVPSVSRTETDAHWLELEIVLRLCVSHSFTGLMPWLQRSRLEI